MKGSLLLGLLSLFALLANDVQAQWSKNTRIGALKAVHFLDDKVGFGCEESRVFKTASNGVSWAYTLFESKDSIRSVSFFNERVGVVATDTSVLRTTDGGETFTQVLSSRERNLGARFHGAYFMSDSTVITVGAYNAYTSFDAGATWEPFSGLTPSFPLSILFCKKDRLFVCEYFLETRYNTLSRYIEPNGLQWYGLGFERCACMPHFIPHSMYFESEQNGWIVGDRDTTRKQSAWLEQYAERRVFYTTDRGQTWRYPEFVFPNTVTAVGFVDRNRGYIGDVKGILYKTTDGGLTWDVDDAPTGGGWVATIAANAGVVHVFGNGYYLRQKVVTSVSNNEEPLPLGMAVFPNPAGSTVRISFEYALSVGTVIQFMDIMGRTVLSVPTEAAVLDVDVSELQRGIYMVRATQDGVPISTRMLVKQE